MNTVAGKKILYVDDEPGLALLGKEFLGDLNYLVTSAFSGSMALKLFVQEDQGFDLVITDESMPGMSGIDLAKELKRISPRTPIILCSGHLLTMQEAGMEETNIRAVLIKTEVCTRLPELIEKVLKEQAASAD
jgi:CheY-like chemotaxis protein